MSTIPATTASTRSKCPPLLGETNSLPTLDCGLHIFTPTDAICQQIRGLPLPTSAMMSCIPDAVNISLARHKKTNGSTVSISHGDLADLKLFSVAIYPERTIELWDRPTQQELFDFAQGNIELLMKPAHALGTWFNDWGQVHVLDVVVCLADRNEALALGLRFGQLAIYDLESHREIPVPGRALSRNTGGGR